VNTAHEGRGVMASPGGAQLLVSLITTGDGTDPRFSVRMNQRPAQPDLMVL